MKPNEPADSDQNSTPPPALELPETGVPPRDVGKSAGRDSEVGDENVSGLDGAVLDAGQEPTSSIPSSSIPMSSDSSGPLVADSQGGGAESIVSGVSGGESSETGSSGVGDQSSGVVPELPVPKAGLSRVGVSGSWHGVLERALARVSERRWSEAQLGLSEALVLAPGYELPDLYALRSYTRLHNQDAQGAWDDATACLGLDPGHHEAWWWRAIASASLQRWNEAVADLERSLELSNRHQRSKREWLSRIVESATTAWKSRLRDSMPTAEQFAHRACWALAVNDLGQAERQVDEALRLDDSCLVALWTAARLALRQGRLEEGLSRLFRAAELGPTRPETYRLRAQIYAALGKRCLALQDTETLDQLSSGQLSDQLDLAWFRSSLGDHLKALEQVDECRRRDPENLAVLSGRARLLGQLRCWRLAAEQWQEFLGLRPRDVTAWVELGQCQLKLKRLDAAQSTFERAVQLAPTLPDTHLGLAQAQWHARKPREAMAGVEKALRLETTHLPSQVVMGHLLMNQGELERAIATLQQAWERLRDESSRWQPWDAECAYTLGVLHVEDHPSVALDWFEKSLSRRPDHPGTLVWRAKIFGRQGKMDACQQDLSRARRLNPSCDSAYDRLGRELAQDHLTRQKVRPTTETDTVNQREILQRIIAWEMVGKLEKARQEYLSVEQAGADTDRELAWEWALTGFRLRVQRADAETLEELSGGGDDALTADQAVAVADILCEQGWEESHLVWLQHQAERWPDHGTLAHGVGDACCHLRRYKAATLWLSRALALGHVEAETLALRGESHLARSQYAEAVRDLSIALERHPNQAEWLSLRGEAFLKEENYDAAMTDFELALTIDAKQPKAYCGRAMVMARRGDWEPALLWLTKALHRFRHPEDLASLVGCRGKIFFNMKRYGRAIQDWDWAIQAAQDSRESAAWYFSRSIAWFHQESMDRMRHDLDRCLMHNPKHRAAQGVLDWLENRSERFPAQLAAPRKKISPTRPPIEGEAWEGQAKPKREPEFPLQQWVVRDESGVEYGPIEFATLKQWCSEGRVVPQTWVLRADWDRWRRAEVAFRARAVSARTTRTEDPHADSLVNQDDEVISFRRGPAARGPAARGPAAEGDSTQDTKPSDGPALEDS